MISVRSFFPKLNLSLLRFLFSNVLLRGIGFITQFLLVFFISVEQLGFIKISFGFLELFKVIVTLGTTTALLKMNTMNGISYEDKNINTIYSLCFVGMFGLIFSALIYGLSESGVFSSNEIVNSQISFLSLYSVLVALNLVLMTHYQVNDKYKELSDIQVLSKSIGFIFFLIFTAWLGVAGYLISLYMMAMVTLILMSRVLFDIRVNRNKILNKSSLMGFYLRVRKLAGYSLASNLISTFNRYVSVLVASFTVFDPIVMGYVGVALTLVMILELITSTMQQYFMPKMGELSHDVENWYKYFKKLEVKYLKIAMCTSICLVLVVWVFNRYYFKDEHNITWYVLILASAWLISSFYSLKNPFFISAGKPEVNLVCGLISLPVTIAISIATISYFNEQGVVLARLGQSLFVCLIYGLAFRVVKRRHAL